MRVRDQYGAVHDINESQLAYEPWRSCEVVAPEAEQPEPADAPKGAEPAKAVSPARPEAPKSSSKTDRIIDK